MNKKDKILNDIAKQNEKRQSEADFLVTLNAESLNNKNNFSVSAVEDIFVNAVVFSHLQKNDKKSPDFDLPLNINNEEINCSHDSFHRILNFRDPNTGLIVAKLPNNNYLQDNVKSITVQFRQMITRELSKQWHLKYEELKTLRDKDDVKYNDTYKPLSYINTVILSKLADPSIIATKLLTKLRLLVNDSDLHLNEQLVFKDTTIIHEDHVTSRLPYLDPAKQKITEDDQKTVKDLLNPFMDEDNQQVFLWFMGACLANIDSRKISKMLVVSSSKGGNGKNTLFESTLNALFPQYYDMKSSLDDYFTRDNRFAISNLLPLHVTMFSEAEFNDGKNEDHDFKGYRINNLKTLISDGQFMSEVKYENSRIRYAYHSFFITLTNHFPDISQDKQALNRRLLPLVLKSSSMAEKGHELGLLSRDEIFDEFYKHRQELANVCYHYFINHVDQFIDYEYDKNEAVNEIAKADDAYNSENKDTKQELKDLANKSLPEFFRTLTIKYNINFDDLANLIDKIDLEDSLDYKFKYADIIRSERVNGELICYLNSTKKLLTTLTGNENARNVLISIFDKPIVKFHKRMFKLNGKTNY